MKKRILALLLTALLLSSAIIPAALATSASFDFSGGCDECGELTGHLESCSQYGADADTAASKPADDSVVICDECHCAYGHTDECSLNPANQADDDDGTDGDGGATLTICGECQGMGTHAETCSQYICPECSSNPCICAFLADWVEVNENGSFNKETVTLYYDATTDGGTYELTAKEMPESILVEYSYTDDNGTKWYLINSDEWLTVAEEDSYPGYVKAEDVTLEGEESGDIITPDLSDKSGTELFDAMSTIHEQGDEALVAAMDTLTNEQVQSLVDNCDHNVLKEWGKLHPDYPGDDCVSYPAPVKSPYAFTGYVGSMFSTTAASPWSLRSRAASPVVDNEALITGKTAVYNNDGTVTITINAHTESQVVTVTKPCDIVLVLDYSGSMSWTMERYKYTKFNGTPSTSGEYFILRDGVYSSVNYREWSIINLFGHTGWWVDDFWFLGYFGGTEVSHVADGTGEVQTDGTLGYQFYTREVIDANITRWGATIAAASEFIKYVRDNSPESRIAVVAFDGSSHNWTNGLQNVVTYEGFNDDDSDGIVNVIDRAAQESGATAADYGMQEAADIFAADNSDAQKVVIMFTDGDPNHQNGFDETVANNTIRIAAGIKGTYNAKIYTIGLFSDDEVDDQIDSYMNGVSSNYGSDQTSMPGQNDSPVNSGYYFRTDDVGQLNNIFTAIAQETGESIEDAVVKDVLAPQLELSAESKAAIEAAGGKVTVEDGITTIEWDHDFTPATTIEDEGWFSVTITAKVKDGFLGGNFVQTNGDESGVYADGAIVENFERPTVDVPIEDVTVDVKDKHIYLLGSLTTEQLLEGSVVKCGDVTLDPSKENYGLADWQTAYVSFPYGDSFNNVTTDTTYTVKFTVAPAIESDAQNAAKEKSGSDTANIYVYKPVQQTKDSAIYLTQTAPDYDTTNLDGSVTWKHGDTVAVPANMIGTEPTVTYTYSPAEAAFTADTNVNITAKIGDTNIDDYIVYTGADDDDHEFTVYVYKPEITFNDSVIYLGETPDYGDNGGSVEWKHGTDIADQEVMGTPPAVTLGYDPTAKAFETDTYVNVTVTIDGVDHTGNTTFVHGSCNEPGCGFNPANGEFIVHVRNCTLTITKSGANSGDSFIFNVTGPNGFSRQVVITGNGSVTLTGLRIGEYTVTEDTSWSWRYTTENGTQTANITAENTSVTITVTNTYSNDQWLGDETAAENVFEKN